jgi:hypothetical protein
MMGKTPNGELEKRGLLFLARHRGAEFGEPDGAMATEILAEMDLAGEEAGLRQAWRVFKGMRQIPLVAVGWDGFYRLTQEGAERIAPQLILRHLEKEEGNE